MTSEGRAGTSRICLCLTSPTIKGALSQIERYRPYVDLAEMRADLLLPEERNGLVNLPKAAGIPLILTIRLPEDGGRWGGAGEDENQRTDLFVSLLETGGWAYVDLEHDRPMNPVVDAARSNRVRIIRSRHDFRGELLDAPISEIAAWARGIAEHGDMPKLASHCTGSRQLLALVRVAMATTDIEEKVLLGMGEYGAPSRILSGRIGSAWTYASSMGGPDDPPAAAPGQSDPQVLDLLYRCRALDTDTPLYAVVGNPVSHSRSPIIHNTWLRDAGLPGTYIPMRADDAAAMLETCDILGIRGLSVTVPHKETVLALCDHAGHLARKIGAANTLLRAGDGWRGRNTDAAGFLAPLPAALGLDSAKGLHGMKALIIGAGGAARAAVWALSDAGVEMVILNRSEEKAQRLAGEVGAKWGPLTQESLALLVDGVDFAVQTTSVGMHPDIGQDPVPWWNPAGCSLVYDMIYRPEKTALLARAEEVGIAILNGSSMLENQARLQFELFTGHPAPS